LHNFGAIKGEWESELENFLREVTKDTDWLAEKHKFSIEKNFGMEKFCREMDGKRNHPRDKRAKHFYR
jgi:hypothetical protein